MTEFICAECGETENSDNWLSGEKLLQAGHCLMCDFWLGIITNTEPVVIEGACYTVGPENIGTRNRWWRGFGGRAFTESWPESSWVLSRG